MKFIFTTDGHLSSKRPVARTEETDELYIVHQLAKRKQMLDYAESIEAQAILDGGDFFQYWKMDDASNLLIKLIALMQSYHIEYLTNIGNHDLQYHAMENLDNSLLGLINKIGLVGIKEIVKFGKVQVQFFHYGKELIDKTSGDYLKIAVIHENIFQKSVPPYMTGLTAEELIQKLPNFDLYLCGHNHEQFIYPSKDKIVINGGSIMRLNTKQDDYEPAFWEISIDEPLEHATMRAKNIWVKKHLFNVLPNMISKDHLKNKQIETFVESTQEFAEGKEAFDFRKDVENELEVRKTEIKVKNLVYTALEN